MATATIEGANHVNTSLRTTVYTQLALIDVWNAMVSDTWLIVKQSEHGTDTVRN